MKTIQITTITYLLSLGLSQAASQGDIHAHDSNGEHITVPRVTDGHDHDHDHDHDNEHGADGEHAEDHTNCDHEHEHEHGSNGEHAEDHINCDHEHEHEHGPNGEHAEDHTNCDHEHEHEHGSNGEHAEDHINCDHDREHGTSSEMILVNAHARDIIDLRTQKAPAVQRNLVASLHGFLDIPAHAYKNYALPSSGRLDIKVRSAQQVKKGDLLFTIDSPEISDLLVQQKDAEASYKRLLSDIDTMEARLSALAQAGTRSGELEEQLRFKKAEATQQLHKGQNISTRLRSAAMGAEMIQRGDQILLGIRAQEDGGISNIELRQGSWAQQGESVLSMIDPHSLEINASLYGNEQAHFSEAIATIPIGSKEVSVKGKLRISDQVDPIKQTRQLYFVADKLPQGAQAGLLCRIDLYQHDAAQQGISIPSTSIIKVGVDDIVFLKRSADEYEAVKVSVLGTRRDMSTVAGIRSGDEVVVAGGYELKFLLGGGSVKQKQTGHFHADGTFHEGEDH